METCIETRDHNHDDREYDALLARLNGRYKGAIIGGAAIFTTDATGLWDEYLAGFSNSVERQYHNCHACRHFIERFGGLAVVGEQGQLVSALWEQHDINPHYREAFARLDRAVRKARITGPFLSSEAIWGTPVTKQWHHMHIEQQPDRIYRERALDAHQAMAEKREDFKNVNRALSEFPLPAVEQALTLLETDALYRAEKVIAPARWLRDLHLARQSAGHHTRAKENITWEHIAQVPAGFCHPRSSMVGTLLEDIVSGMPFTDVAARFKAKMHPLQYQRPQAAPSDGAIAAAEKLVEKLKIDRSLPRRFARFEDIQEFEWVPKEKDAPAGGVFGHLKNKPRAPELKVPVTTMTWEKFQRTVLPTADSMEIYVGSAHASFTSLVTAAHGDAPPILQWDHEEHRNPVSWYYYHGGSTAERFSLASHQFHRVNGITLKPSMWRGNKHAHGNQGEGVMFVIEGARDKHNTSGVLFPETLKAELHGVRSVIEAYSKSATLAGKEQASAAGIMPSKGQPWDIHLRVVGGGRSAEYRLDRWD